MTFNCCVSCSLVVECGVPLGREADSGRKALVEERDSSLAFVSSPPKCHLHSKQCMFCPVGPLGFAMQPVTLPGSHISGPNEPCLLPRLDETRTDEAFAKTMLPTHQCKFCQVALLVHNKLACKRSGPSSGHWLQRLNGGKWRPKFHCWHSPWQCLSQMKDSSCAALCAILL